MTKRIIAIALLCSAGVFSAFGGGGSGNGTALTPAQIAANRVARLTVLLSLTTAQANQATAIFTTSETALATIETNETTARTALITAIEANSVSGISAAATTLGNLEMQEVPA